MDEIICSAFENVLGLKKNCLNDCLSMADVENWDSVNHLSLILSLEQSLDIEFSPQEISRMTSIGEIKAVILKRLGSDIRK
jgi:acyl carrier protein